MTKINPQEFIKEINGKESALTVGQAIANILLASETSGKMKSFVMAQKFYNDTKDIEIDSADLAIIRQAVETTKAYNNLVSGQILVLLDSLKS